MNIYIYFSVLYILYLIYTMSMNMLMYVNVMMFGYIWHLCSVSKSSVRHLTLRGFTIHCCPPVPLPWPSIMENSAPSARFN